MNENFRLVKERVDILDIIGEDLTLKKNGKVYKSNCPFHGDRTPSFTVYPDSQRYHCFGCKAEGDVVDYVKEKENLTSTEALQLLADKYNVTLVGIDKEYFGRRKQAINTNRNQYKPFYQEKDFAVKYMQDFRGIVQAITDKFNIGYNKKNHSVTIPLFDTYGELIGMAERFLSEDSPIKYKNSAESEFFKKSDLLYGLHVCRKSISEQIYIVEGYFDVLSMYQLGIGKTIGYSGQAITESQSKLLSNYITNGTKIYLIPDKDKTGQNFIKKNIKTLRLHNKNRISIIDLPEGCKDINDYLLTGGKFEDLPVYPFEMYLLKQDLDNCLEIEDEYEVAYEYAKNTPNKMIRADMANMLSKRWNKSIELVREHMNSESQSSDYSSKLYTASEAFVGYTKNVMEGSKNKVFTSYKDIDRIIKGIKPGEVMTILGRSGAGKTTFIVNLIYNVVFKQFQNVIFNSLELAKENVIPQFLQIHKKLPLHKLNELITKGKYDEETNFVLETLDKHFRIADDDSQSLEDLENFILAANETVFDEPVKVIFVDYFQYMKPAEGNKQRHEKMAEVARGLKALAKRRNIIVIALSQANREEGRDGSEKLSKSSAGDTRAIEESSDYLLGIRRTSANSKLTETEKQQAQHEMYCQILKNRWGMETEIPLYFEGITKRIEDSEGRVQMESVLEDVINPKRKKKGD